MKRETRRRAAQTGEPSKGVVSKAATPRLADPLPLRHPAFLAALLIAAVGVALSVTFRISDPDLWQHLTVGRAIWEMKSIPRVHLWSWPLYGTPEVLPSWGFRALLWPFYQLGGVNGLFVWKWLTTLTAFGFLWAAARRMGARGLAPLVAIVVCSLTYRHRSQVRPETLVAVLLALQVWILETRRHGGPDRSPWLIAVAWAWANVHISYYLGFVLLAIHVVGDLVAGRKGRGPTGALRLIAVGLACAAVSFLNPFGWRALAQPFQFYFQWRHEPIFLLIGELTPVTWRVYWRNLLPLLVGGTAALALWRWRRQGFDLVELLTLAFAFGVGLSSQRFLGTLALVVAPYLARDLDAFVRSRSWPAWTEPPWTRAALAAAACVALGLPEWTRPALPISMGLYPRRYPVAACDFMARHGVRGRGFMPFETAGYVLWRFWPDRARLPFMDIHQTGTREDRDDYAFASTRAEAWTALDQRRGFEYALVLRSEFWDGLLETLDADSSWALVFLDDPAALYVRRAGPLAALGDSFAYREVPAGSRGVFRVGEACARDSSLRVRVAAELERQIEGSLANGNARSQLAYLELSEGRWEEVRAQLRLALAVNPLLGRAHERLAIVALMLGDPREALRELEIERRRRGSTRWLDLRFGQAYRQLGELGRAREAYRRELLVDPGNAEARDSLAALGRTAGP